MKVKITINSDEKRRISRGAKFYGCSESNFVRLAVSIVCCQLINIYRDTLDEEVKNNVCRHLKSNFVSGSNAGMPKRRLKRVRAPLVLEENEIKSMARPGQKIKRKLLERPDIIIPIKDEIKIKKMLDGNEEDFQAIAEAYYQQAEKYVKAQIKCEATLWNNLEYLRDNYIHKMYGAMKGVQTEWVKEIQILKKGIRQIQGKQPISKECIEIVKEKPELKSDFIFEDLEEEKKIEILNRKIGVLNRLYEQCKRSRIQHKKTILKIKEDHRLWNSPHRLARDLNKYQSGILDEENAGECYFGYAEGELGGHLFIDDLSSH